MGARRRDDRRPRAAHDPRLGRAARRSSRAPGRERAGEVRGPARRAQRRTAPTTVVEPKPDARPHRADARGGGARVRRSAERGDRRAGRRAAARRGRRPGRLLVGRAAARRRGARPGQRRHGARARRSTRAAPACSTCSSGWARASPSSTGAAPAASRSATCRCSTASSIATEITADEVPRLVDELPLVALLGLARARRDASSRGAARAAREGERPHRGGHRRPARARRADPFARRTAGGSPACPRGCSGGRVDARGDHRIAMLGAIAGLASREGVEIEGAETVAISFPGFFELLDSVVRR